MSHSLDTEHVASSIFKEMSVIPMYTDTDTRVKLQMYYMEHMIKLLKDSWRRANRDELTSAANTMIELSANILEPK